ncbi:MAG: hypothetical protein QM503_03420 [Bacteroidota bacterium]
MKIITKISALLATLTILLTTNLSASVINFNEELYINDIPFNTTEIYKDIITEQNLAEFELAEEDYVNDIPFDTKCVTANCLYNDAVSISFQLEEEEYVDDIPFDTECISANCKYLKATQVEFNFEEEEYIDDMKL